MEEMEEEKKEKIEDEKGEGMSRSKRMKIKRGGRRRWRRRRTRRRGDEGEWNPGVGTDDPTAPGMTWTDRRQGRIRPDPVSYTH